MFIELPQAGNVSGLMEEGVLCLKPKYLGEYLLAVSCVAFITPGKRRREKGYDWPRINKASDRGKKFQAK